MLVRKKFNAFPGNTANQPKPLNVYATRAKEVVAMVRARKTNEQIADELGMSLSAVRRCVALYAPQRRVR